MQESGGRRFIALDSMRGLCALFVAIYHFSCLSNINSLPFIQNGFLFVDFFFVLSGFVISASYGEKLRSGYPVSTFMFLRLGRLYPLHLFVLALIAVIAALKPGAYSLADFGITVLLLQVFTDGHLSNWNLPSWSISAEVWTYLIFAVMCRYLGRYILVATALIAGSAPFVLVQFSDRYIDVCFAGAIFRSLLGFSLGAICYRMRPSRLSQRPPHFLQVLFLFSSIAIVSIAGAGPLSLACPFVFAVCIYFLADDRGFVATALTAWPFLIVGNLSYSIYMTHTFVQARLLNILDHLIGILNLPIVKEVGGTQTISNAPGHLLVADTTVVIMVFIVLLVSSVTYRYIETPFRLMSRRAIRQGATVA